jgi:hypothetical protein
VIGLYCSADSQTQKSITVSESPGGFVCNNTAYNLGIFFDKLKVPYSFIHVPSHVCKDEGNSDEPAQSAGNQLARLIKDNLTVFQGKIFKGEYKKICNYLPTSVAQIDQFKQIISSVQNESSQKCDEDFLAKLKERLLLWTPKNSTY